MDLCNPHFPRVLIIMIFKLESTWSFQHSILSLLNVLRVIITFLHTDTIRISDVLQLIIVEANSRFDIDENRHTLKKTYQQNTAGYDRYTMMGMLDMISIFGLQILSKRKVLVFLSYFNIDQVCWFLYMWCKGSYVVCKPSSRYAIFLLN